MKERMSLSGIILGLFVTVMISGCSITKGRDGHTYVDGNCITCINNPVTGESVNYTKTSEDYAKAEKYKVETGQTSGTGDIPYEEGRVKFSARTNIDKAYLKLKREFGFMTRKERLRGFGYNDKGWLDSAEEFRYEALPGVSYHMREHTTHNYKGKSGLQTIDVLLETNGAGTDIIITFWVQQPRARIVNFGSSLKSRALRALR